ncbi:MAG: Na/Pi cotransporter family protein [Lachnospiraceae bacterium]|nr:Na/Pi cotransporter family protein [Lachnospiraceae bacterium]
MNLYSCIGAIGGLAFFLFGMNILSSGLKNVAGDKLENVLQKMTDHPMKGLLFGAIITIAMQSSSALTVMLVGLVNSGIMTLTQTVGIIMGSNIGTTLTAWLLSLSGVNTDNVLLSMMKPENFAPLLALLGVIFMMAAKGKKQRELGSVMAGFAILMHGMEMMSDSLSPLAEVPEFTSILTAFRNPLLGVIIGMLFTGIIQSSAASVGVLQALSLTGHVTYGVAIPIIMGQNIGTCVTALLSSIGVSKNAKRVSIIHVSFNLIGTIIGLVIYLLCKCLLNLAILDMKITPFAIAAFHSVFNVATTIVLLPFGKQLVWIAEHVISEDAAGEVFLDDRLLLSPVLAATECRRKAILILNKSVNGFCEAMNMLGNYDNKKREGIRLMEEEVDEMVEACNNFLIRLSEKDVSPKESRVIADMLHNLGDMERISDYSLGLSGTVKKIHKEEFKHKKELQETLAPVNQKLYVILSSLTEAYKNKDKVLAEKMVNESAELVTMTKKIKKANLRLLRVQKVEAEGSVYLSDYLTISRRVAEHSANIAESLM